MTALIRLLLPTALLFLPGLPLGAEPTVVTVFPDRLHQEFDGMGCGIIFYEGHITSLAQRGKNALQKKLYDEMFRDVKTDYLHLMIRHDHEPENDNDDPWVPDFDEPLMKWCESTLQICAAAKTRNPKMKLYATLYSPPAWMKTNNDITGGGEKRGTLKPGLELEMAEFMWAYLAHMSRRGHPVEFLSICNEPDWPHTQPGYFLTPEQHTALFGKVVAYFAEMAKRHPQVPIPRLVAPNTLSAVDTAKRWLPPLLREHGEAVAVVGCHDYDRRGDRWKTLSDMAGGRPVWLTEWCVNGPDATPLQFRSSAEYWLAMTEAFNGGAHVWMAYDWVYPPRDGGEALIHLDWGQNWKRTRIYDGFRQWCQPLEQGMRLAETKVTGPAASGFSQPGIKTSAFLDPKAKRLAVHIANASGETSEIAVHIEGLIGPHTVAAWRTSEKEAMISLPASTADPGAALNHTLPPRGLLTLELTPRP